MLTIHLNPSLPAPLYEQIYLYIRDDIRHGILKKGTRLPSTRSLATHLSVSRNTVDMAYGQLSSEGYIEARPKSGYYICDMSDYFADAGFPSKLDSRSQTAFHSQAVSVSSGQGASGNEYRYNFSPFSINTAGFPYRIWQRLTRECLSSHGSELFLLGNRQGERSLRLAISEYLYEARGFHTSPDNILIGAGADYLLQLLIQFLEFPQYLAMEDPGYQQAWRIFTSLGCRVVPIPLDNSGILTASLRHVPSPVKAVYLTPSHQYPLGFVLSAGRRRELLQWADETGSFLIEDDHDSEFRYKGKPIPALKEMDRSDSVIYIGTFSRTIAPAIRAGYMVLPDRLMEIYHKRFRHIACPVSRIDQMILTDFMTNDYYERHLNKSRKVYKNRHDVLLISLREMSRTHPIEVFGENAGLHMAVQFKGGYTECELICAASKIGIRLYGLSDHFLSPHPEYPATILFGFGDMKEEDILEGIRLLESIL